MHATLASARTRARTHTHTHAHTHAAQVIESLLLILLDLRQVSVPQLSKDVASLHKLLDALGELSASQQQVRCGSHLAALVAYI